MVRLLSDLPALGSNPVVAQINSSAVIGGLVLGITAAVFALALIWSKPRKPTFLWVFLSFAVLGATAAGTAAAFLGAGSAATTSAVPKPVVGRPTGRATCAPNGTVLSVTAQGIAFNKACLAAPAGRPFTVEFANDDSGISHNVAIYTDESAAENLFSGEILPGPESRTYEVPALDAGTYYFRCDVHPTQMSGTFIAE